MRRLIVLGAGLAVMLGTASIAAAQFTSSAGSGPMGLSSATLAAPTGLTVNCNNGVATLSWTATSSTWADGYDVLRGTTSGGPYPTIVHVVGGTTVTYNATLSGTVRLYYVVRASKYNWRSGYSNQRVMHLAEAHRHMGPAKAEEARRPTLTFPSDVLTPATCRSGRPSAIDESYRNCDG